MYILIVLIISLLELKSSGCAKILAVFPVASISHQAVFRPLTQELAKRGHEVVVITTDVAFPENSTRNLKEIDVHDVSYKVWHQHEAVTEDKSNFYSQYQLILDLHTLAIDQQFQNEDVKDIINKINKDFDLLLIEACVRPTLALTYLFKVPVIQISSFGALFNNYETIGAPTHPTLYSSIMNQRIYNLNPLEQVKELLNYFMFHKLLQNHAEVDKLMLKKHFPVEIPSYEQLQNNVDILMLNIHQCMEGYYPVPLSTVYIGGIHKVPQKPLAKSLQAFLDGSPYGVVYFSFGSNVLPSLLPNKTIQVFLRVLSQLPYNVLLKWDKDKLPGKQASNIKIAKWFPQIDILNHPNTKVFITQAGLQSTEEAIASGIPLIGLPLMLDQWYNAEKYLYNNIGIKMDVNSLTDDVFRNAIISVIQNDSYRQNIMKLQALMSDQRHIPLYRAVWWTEYVLRYGGARHMRAPAANMPWVEYFEIELIVILILNLFFILSVILTVILKLYKILKRYY